MFKKVECISIICDNCGEIFQDLFTDFSLFLDKEASWDKASEESWYEHDGKHYCPDCYTIDNDDNFILKPK